MTRLRCTTRSPARRGGVMIDAERLEGRRLFSGLPGRHGPAGHDGPAFGPGGSVAIVVDLFINRPARPTGDANSLTAAPIGTPAETAAGPAAVASVPTLNTANTPSSNAPTARAAPANSPVPVAAVESASTPAAVPVNVVSEVVGDTATTPDAAAIARPLSPARPTPTDAASPANGPVFGPFVVQAATATANVTDSLGSLLTQKLYATNDAPLARPSTGTNPNATTAKMNTAAEADAGLPVVTADEAVAVDQASLAAVPVDLSLRGLWQRVAVATAGVTLVAANWIVRRRQRRVALGWSR